MSVSALTVIAVRLEKSSERKQEEEKPKPVNYTKIAITGLLFHYKPKNVTVVVDGKRYQYKKCGLPLS